MNAMISHVHRPIYWLTKYQFCDRFLVQAFKQLSFLWLVFGSLLIHLLLIASETIHQLHLPITQWKCRELNPSIISKIVQTLTNYDRMGRGQTIYVNNRSIDVHEKQWNQGKIQLSLKTSLQMICHMKTQYNHSGSVQNMAKPPLKKRRTNKETMSFKFV